MEGFPTDGALFKGSVMPTYENATMVAKTNEQASSGNAGSKIAYEHTGSC
jgi:hypothetical protein